MFVARVPKFLNLSAAGHARLALPPAKIALVAASCLFAIVGVGAFVVALPGMSFSADAVVDDAAQGQSEKDARAADASEQPAEDADAQEDAAATEAGETDSQDVAAAVDYLLEWEWNSFGAGCPTPASAALDGCNAGACAGVTPCLGLVRVCEVDKGTVPLSTFVIFHTESIGLMSPLPKLSAMGMLLIDGPGMTADSSHRA